MCRDIHLQDVPATPTQEITSSCHWLPGKKMKRGTCERSENDEDNS